MEQRNKILHLIIDHQVIERSLGIFETLYPGQNEVLIFEKKDSYKHLHKYAICQRVNDSNLEEFVKSYDFSDVKYVISHYMNLWMAEFILQVPRYVHCCWEIYGYDLYNQFLEPQGLNIYYTHPFKFQKYSLFRSLFPNLFNHLLSRRGVKYATNKEKKLLFDRVADRVDSLGVCTTGDVEILEKYSGKKFPYFLFCNYSLREVFGDLWGSEFTEGNNIMIGNSASFSNNHLYVLEYMKRINFDSDIVLTLSYGGNSRYRDAVIRSYSKAFPNRIKTLLNYIPLHEYNKSFLGYNSMIMAAWRQESIGTIMLAFYLGIKVYMSEKSPLYNSWKKEGFKIYAIESNDIEHISKPLSMEDRIHNRNLLLETYNEQNIINSVRTHFR